MTRRALVYRGRAACEGCPEALAELLRGSRWKFEVNYVGDDESPTTLRDILTTAALYAQPGGGKSVQRAYRQTKKNTRTIRDYVQAGGRYLGICMGGYLAGHWRGFGLLPGDTDQFITSPGADITTKKDTLVQVEWRGRHHHMFFQDGPIFELPHRSAGVTVLARYASNGEIAAMVAPFGLGKVGVCGPHPEAPEEWYEAHNLPRGDESPDLLGHDLLDTLME